MLSVFCLNGQVSLGKAFDLLIANTEMLHFLPAFKAVLHLSFLVRYAGGIEEYPSTK